jgi:hypothetical protein
MGLNIYTALKRTRTAADGDMHDATGWDKTSTERITSGELEVRVYKNAITGRVRSGQVSMRTDVVIGDVIGKTSAYSRTTAD